MSDRLAHEVRSIRPPTGWRLVDTEVGNKSIATGVSLRYTGSASTSYLQRYIRSEFKKNGWTYCMTRETVDGSQLDLDFRQTDFVGIVTMDNTPQSRNLAIDASWNEFGGLPC